MEKSEGVIMAKREVILFAFILASLAVVNVGCASAATHYVNPGDSIQSAINFANSGDTIIVRDGTYTVNILVDKSLTIQSERGYDNCIVQTDDYCTISVEADYVNISGFTLKTTAEYMSASTIRMDHVDFCNISNNKCSCNGIGFDLLCSNNNIITNNICVNNKNGIHLGGSNNNTVTNNNCSNNSIAGISIGASYYNSIMNNVSANNSKYGIFLFSNSDKNIITNNTCYSNNRGIWVTSGSSSCRITNNICSNNMLGIFFRSTSNDNTVTNNNCSNNLGAGIVIGASYYNSIMNNVCANNSEYGIYLWGSDHNRIYCNNCSNNNYGIYNKDSNGNHIYNNNCSNNNFGIYNKDSNDNRIYCNNCSNNNFGIHLGSNYSIPVGAVNIKDCNIAYLNNIISKNDNGKSAGNENAWYSESSINYSYKGKTYNSHLGNYWGDYEGTDGDGDGIGDAPYVIDDAYRGKDKYPLMEPFENYKIAKFNDSFFEM